MAAKKRGRPTASQLAAAKASGAKGGRPPERSEYEKKILDRAIFEARRSVLENVRYLVAIRDGRVPGVTTQDRLRAIENLLDRAGLPKLTQQEIHTDGEPVKLFDFKLDNDDVLTVEELPGPEGGTPEPAQPADEGQRNPMDEFRPEGLVADE
jgi:hypothetical protein